MTGSKRIMLQILAAAILPLLSACNGSSYRIDGQAGDVDGVAVLSWMDLQGGSSNDTTTVTKGRFVFSGEIDDAYNAQISVKSADGQFARASLVLEKGRISFTMYPDRFSEKPFCESVATGTRNNDFLISLDEAINHMRGEDMRNAMRGCIMQHKDCEYAAFLYSLYFDDQPLEDYVAMFESFPEYVRESVLASQFRNTIASRSATAEGRTAPDFTLKDMEGKDVTLSSFRGEYVIVDFWASWCVPCRRGVPAMKETYSEYHSKGLEIIAVSQDDDAARWRKAVIEDGSEWIHLIDEPGDDGNSMRVGDMYGIRSIPSYFLLDKEGRFIGKFDHEGLEARLKELL